MDLIVKCSECKHRYEWIDNQCPICSAPINEDVNELKRRHLMRSRKRSRRETILKPLDRFINVFLGNA